VQDLSASGIPPERVFLGSGDPDPHVPWARVEETAVILSDLGAQVEAQRYPGRGHTISHDELLRVGRLLDKVQQGSRSDIES
jgi:predicted esterase